MHDAPGEIEFPKLVTVGSGLLIGMVVGVRAFAVDKNADRLRLTEAAVGKT
jgi:hypothetical protein